MIEVRFPKEHLDKIEHQTLKAVTLMEGLRKSGIPVLGIIFFLGVAHGVLQWHEEDDLDGPVIIMRWWAQDDPLPFPVPAGRLKVLGRGVVLNGTPHIEWRKIVPLNHVDDDEI